jgi:hypothetical protein
MTPAFADTVYWIARINPRDQLTTPGCLTGVSLIMTPPDSKKSILLAPNSKRTLPAGTGPAGALRSGHVVVQTRE